MLASWHRVNAVHAVCGVNKVHYTRRLLAVGTGGCVVARVRHDEAEDLLLPFTLNPVRWLRRRWLWR